MSAKTRVRMTPSQRFSRGLHYTTVGPVDLTRGAVGMGVDSVRSTAAWAGDRYRNGQLARQLREDLAAAQEVVAGLPDTLGKKRKPARRRRQVLWVGLGIAALAGGAAVFKVARQSAQPEPSPLPPSVEVTPKP